MTKRSTSNMTSQLLTCLLILTVIGTTTCQLNLLDGVIRLLSDGDNQIQKEPPDIPEEFMRDEYDFIIVGAGTAGCALANRLTENPEWNVLLIEAGRPENFMMDLPIIANYLQFTDSNWKYNTEPSGTYCLGFDNRQCNWPRGKVMGGSSVLNYMIFTRGNRRDYDNWAELGNKGWSYDEVLPYFKKVENFTVQEHMQPMDPHYHSTSGHVTVSYSPGKTKIADAIIEASKQLGIPHIDYNGQTQIGVSRVQVSMDDGVRDSSSRAYLHPISKRPNLHVIKYSMVSKILINPQTKTAYGVEYVRHGKKRQVMASKEVISSAGAINSPQLLMLSGIGPKKHLSSLGIPVLKDLKVGYNLMDHVAAGAITFLIDKPYSIRIERLINKENLDLYLNHHQGPLSIAGGCEVLVFHDFSRPNDTDGYPEIELLYEAGSVVSDTTFRKSFGITDEIYKKMFSPIQYAETFMVMPMLMRPKSKGKIMLKDANYKTKPLIYPNYFAVQEDMDIMIKGMRLAMKISEQAPLKALGARLHDIPIPQCSHLKFLSDAYLDCWARHFSFTIYHQSGTCKMGPKSDKKAVVDERLRVYGIKNLRVIDASIMPEVPAAHTNAPTFMIAEKGADMIKQDWGMRT